MNDSDIQTQFWHSTDGLSVQLHFDHRGCLVELQFDVQLFCPIGDSPQQFELEFFWQPTDANGVRSGSPVVIHRQPIVWERFKGNPPTFKFWLPESIASDTARNSYLRLTKVAPH